MRMVRWMCGFKLKDRLPSKELRERFTAKTATEKTATEKRATEKNGNGRNGYRKIGQ